MSDKDLYKRLLVELIKVGDLKKEITELRALVEELNAKLNRI